MSCGIRFKVKQCCDRWVDVDSSDQYAIRSVIQRQLEAFQREDADTAFAFASPEIQAKFEAPANFLRMVKADYPAVYHPRSVIFEQLLMIRGIPTQAVMLLAPDGSLIKALYLMERQADYSWRISGCLLAPI